MENVDGSADKPEVIPATKVSDVLQKYTDPLLDSYDVVYVENQAVIDHKKQDIETNVHVLHEVAMKNDKLEENESGNHGANSVLVSSEDSAVEKDEIIPSRANGTVDQVQSRLSAAEESDKTGKRLQKLRVKFLRIAYRLGLTPHDVFVNQVMYSLRLAGHLSRRNGNRDTDFSIDRATAIAEQLEADGQEPLDFTCNILVIGKTGVGKSATINSIFGEKKFSTDAFQLGTKKVEAVVGTVQGIRVRFIDTPGLLSSGKDQRQNVKILESVKRFIKRTPPDIVLYLDRLDMQTRNFGDMPILRAITKILGVEIWFKVIVVLTHAASALPEDLNGNYDRFVTNRSLGVQQAIRQTAGDMRLMSLVSLVENHSDCQKNTVGQRVLPNGQVWKLHLLLQSFASKILFETNTLLKSYAGPGKPCMQLRTSILSHLLQSRPRLKCPEDSSSYSSSDSDSDRESEDEGLPPFEWLTEDEIWELDESHRKAYYNELEHRERLLMKKQLKDEKRQRKMRKKMPAKVKADEEEQESIQVDVDYPEVVLPNLFNSNDLVHRYRHIEYPKWIIRPVMDTHGWDQDIGYDGIDMKTSFTVNDNTPASFYCQVINQKKNVDLDMELASSLKHGKKKSTTVGFDMRSYTHNRKRDIIYTLRSATLFSNSRRNKASAGVSITKEGDGWAAGMKVEDKLVVGRWAQLAVSGGTFFTGGNTAYGLNLEATFKDKKDPVGRFLTKVGASVMSREGDLAIEWNSQAKIPIGRSMNLIGRLDVSNKKSGKLSIKLNCSEPLQIAVVVLMPFLYKWASFQPGVQQ